MDPESRRSRIHYVFLPVELGGIGRWSIPTFMNVLFRFFYFVYCMYIYIYICFCIFYILLVFASHGLDHNLLHSFLDALNIPQWGVGRCREDWIQSFQPPKHQKTHGASSQSWNVAANPQESLRVQLLEGDLSTGKFAFPSHCPGIYDVRCDLPVFPIYGDVSYKQHSLQVFEGYLPGCGPEFAKYNVICQVYQEFGTWWHEALFDDHLLIQIIGKLNFFQWFCHLTKDSQVAST